MSQQLSIAIAGAAALQWIVFIALAAFAKRRALDRRLLASTAVFVVAWCVALDARALLKKPEAKVAEASLIAGGKKSSGSCAKIEIGMSADRVKGVMGEPHEVTPNEEIRGPGAAIWRYTDIRCAVHVVDGKVEFVE